MGHQPRKAKSPGCQAAVSMLPLPLPSVANISILSGALVTAPTVLSKEPRLAGGALRSPAALLSDAAAALTSGVTQTWSDGTTSRQTKPCLHVSGPNEPPVSERRSAALALSLAAWDRVAGVTHTWSSAIAS